MIYGTYTENVFGQKNKGKGIIVLGKNMFLKEKNPSFLAYYNNILYCVNEIKKGKISFYENEIKKGSISTNGKYPCHINIFKNKLVVCNYGGGITLFKIVSEGLIKIKSLYFENINNKGQNRQRQEKSHPHCSLYLEDINQIVVSDLGNDKLYFLDDSFSLKEEIDLSPGSGPRHICQKDNILYITNELSSSISIFNLITKKLSYNKIDGIKNYPSHLNFYKNQLYVANRGNDNISFYDVDQDQITLKGKINLGGSPRFFLIYNDSFYVACQNKNCVEIYEKTILISKIYINSVSFILNCYDDFP